MVMVVIQLFATNFVPIFFGSSCRLKHNGPAIKLVGVPAFSQKKRDGAVFAVRVQALLALRVSRYKLAMYLRMSLVIVILLTVLVRSGFVTITDLS
jgi:hypothetical protein